VLGDLYLGAITATTERSQGSNVRNLCNWGMTGELSVEVKTWIKRLGFWSFLFFLVKGLLWLAIPALIALWATE
jgi:hypothetical protein